MQKNYHITPITAINKGLTGSIRVPSDKSISHRSIMLGALAEGITTVSNFLEGEDALNTMKAFQNMGVKIEYQAGKQVIIHGVGLHGLKNPQNPIDCGNAGTAMRLISGILAGQKFPTTLIGDASLSKRPMKRIVDPLTKMGAIICGQGEKHTPELNISPINNSLKGITYTLPMASAQVKSCLLFAGLYANSSVTIIEPQVTRDHTERMFESFGLTLEKKGTEITFNPQLPQNNQLKAQKIDIPADISSAAFFMVAAAIVPNSHLVLRQVGINPTREGIIRILQKMNANIRLFNHQMMGQEPIADIEVQYSPNLTAITIDRELVDLAIDELPITFIASVVAKGTTIIKDAQELRVKESDRIGVMAEGLKRLGIEVTVTDDGMIIDGGQQFLGGTVETYDDHRIAMSFAIAGLIAKNNVIIENCGHVTTSFPNFTELYQQVGGRLKEEIF